MNTGPSRDKAREYSSLKARLFAADLFATFLYIACFHVFVSHSFEAFILGIIPNYYISRLVFASLFFAGLYVFAFPVHLVSSFGVERRFGLSRQSLKAWLADEAKSACLSSLLTMASVMVFYAVLKVFPLWWWAVSSVLWISFSVLLAFLLPVFVIPLFFKYLPIDDGVLREEIVSLARKAGIKIMEVCRIDFSRKTAKANAALVGLGRTRKVVLSDTLTQDFPLGQIKVVIAHEFGHFKSRHVWKLLLFSAVAAAAGFFALFIWADGITAASGSRRFTDLSVFPVLVFLASFFGAAALPLQNFFSRVLEREADVFALELTQDPAGFISVMERLAEMNLSDTRPSLLKKAFLYNHPPISERIRTAEKYAKSGA